MKHSHVKWTGMAERLTIEEAARLVVKETGKSLDYTISFLTDCAEQGYFTAEVVAHSDYANVSHISRVDPSKSTVSTAELIEWLDGEIEDAHQKAREAVARQETEKWDYEARPEDMRVTLAPEAEQLDALLADDSIRMTTRNWVEYLSLEFAQAQGWEGAERDAKCAVVRTEYLNLFFALADTLPFLQEVSGIPWRGDQLPSEWLTSLHLRKSDLREWAKTHAPEIAKSRILAEPHAVAADAGSAEHLISNIPSGECDATRAQGDGEDWREKVRKIADELDLRDEKSGAWSSNQNIADRVARIAIDKGIRGPHGQLSAGNILREAIQGGRWTRPRKVPTQ